MKITTIILLSIMVSLEICGQGNYFYDKDSFKWDEGIILQNGSDLMNSKFCQIKFSSSVYKYGPSEIYEYGFKDGRIYISKEITILDSAQQVFLELLVRGKTNLYYLKGKGFRIFYLENDHTFLNEIPKKDYKDEKIGFRERLSDFTSDCHNVSDAIKFTSYRKKSLSKLITRYNKCELKPFPHFRYGLNIGYEFTKLIITKGNEYQYINYLDFKYDGGFLIALFADYPISASDFSLHTELNFSKHGFSYNKLVEEKDIDFVSNISSLKIPVLLRYEYPLNKIRPFLNVGLLGSFNIRNEILVYEATITENIIEINDIEESGLIDDIQQGYCIGGGIECRLNYRNSFFFEIRYNNQFSITNPNSIKISEFKFITGINF